MWQHGPALTSWCCIQKEGRRRRIGGMRKKRSTKAVGSQGNRWWRIQVPVLFMESGTVKSVQQVVLCIVCMCACVCECVSQVKDALQWITTYCYWCTSTLYAQTDTFIISPSVYHWSCSDIAHYTSSCLWNEYQTYIWGQTVRVRSRCFSPLVSSGWFAFHFLQRLQLN